MGTKKANELGIFDMSGNVFELCWDWYGEDLEDGENPTGPKNGTYRVIRGGSFCSEDKSLCGVTGRLYTYSGFHCVDNYGFRVVRNDN